MNNDTGVGVIVIKVSGHIPDTLVLVSYGTLLTSNHISTYSFNVVAVMRVLAK